MSEVSEHLMTKTITERIIDPRHAHRRNTKAFRASKRRLKEDGHYRCYICGSATQPEAHHYGCEWMQEEDVDLDELKAFLLSWDVYGYSHLLQHRPITTVDDVRNLMVLCKPHHVERLTGIHEMTFSWWIMQKLAKQGEDPVPQVGEAANG